MMLFPAVLSMLTCRSFKVYHTLCRACQPYFHTGAFQPVFKPPEGIPSLAFPLTGGYNLIYKCIHYISVILLYGSMRF